MALISIDQQQINILERKISRFTVGDKLNFKDCELTLLDWFKEENGVRTLIKSNVATVIFADGRKISLSKLTTHFVDSKPVRTEFGKRVNAITLRACRKQLREQGVWEIINIVSQTTKFGQPTKEYHIQEFVGNL